MATLENIRKRGKLLAIVIGLALAAFILGDIFNSGQALFNSQQFDVVSVNGNGVNIQDYENEIANTEAFYQVMQQTTSLPAETSQQIRSSIWESTIREALLSETYEDLGLENLKITPEKGYIQVNKNYQTSLPNIYAIGDVIGAPWLAHVASHEGIIAAEHIAEQNPHPLDYSKVPGCTYCQPQVASIGLSEEKAKEANLSISIGRFPFVANGKAVASNETEGLVKIVLDKERQTVLGIHIIHPEATELIGEASIICSHKATAQSIVDTIHAHPTLSEGIMEAMSDALGQAIHT